MFKYSNAAKTSLCPHFGICRRRQRKRGIMAARSNTSSPPSKLGRRDLEQLWAPQLSKGQEGTSVVGGHNCQRKPSRRQRRSRGRSTGSSAFTERALSRCPRTTLAIWRVLLQTLSASALQPFRSQYLLVLYPKNAPKSKAVFARLACASLFFYLCVLLPKCLYSRLSAALTRGAMRGALTLCHLLRLLRSAFSPHS